MSDSESQHHERDPEFQQRVLAAVEKPKQNRFLKIINAPLFLWALSVAFVTAGGSYFTQRAECLRNAEDVADKYSKVSTELFFRRALINQIVSDAKSANDIRVGLSNLRSLRPEYSTRTILDLNAEYLRLEAQIHFTTFNPVVESQKTIGPLMSDEHFIRYNAINYGTYFPSFSDAELIPIKRFFERLNKDEFKLRARNTYLSYSPSCSLATWVHSLLSESKPVIVTATTNVSDEEIKNLMVQTK